MKHFILFFYIISFSSGIASSCVALLLYFQHKKIAIKNYFWLLFSLAIIMFSFILSKYIDIVNPTAKTDILEAVSVLNIIGYLLLIYILPSFFHSIMGVKISEYRHRIFLITNTLATISIIFLIIGVSDNETVNRFIEYFILDPILILYIVYGLYLIIADYNSISERVVRNAIFLFLVITIIYLPIHIIEEYRYQITAIRDYELLELFSLPLYFFVINILSMIFSIRYYNQPAFWIKNSLSDFFVDKYKITEREVSIVNYLVDGFSNSEISKKMFISNKTVENHLSNIYSKVGIKNRVQLVNLVLSNK